MHPNMLPCDHDVQADIRAGQLTVIHGLMEESCDPINEVMIDYGELGCLHVFKSIGTTTIFTHKWYDTIDDLLKARIDYIQQLNKLHVKRLIDQANEAMSDMAAYIKDLEANWTEKSG